MNIVISREELLSFQDLVRRVPVAENVVEFVVDFVSSTRPGTSNAPDFINDWIEWGAGPRASQYLILGAKAKAVLDGRPTPNEDDIRELVLPVLRHRILPNFNAEAEGLNTDDILLKLLDEKEFFTPKEKKQSMLLNINNLIYRLEPNDKELRILASIISSLAKK